MFKQFTVISAGLVFMGGCGAEGGDDYEVEESGQELAGSNSAGLAETVHTSGAIDRTNAFFQALGANPLPPAQPNLRSCETCHDPNQGWTITAAGVSRLFRQTDGLAPVFMVHDAGSRPDADITTLKARKTTFGPNLVDRAVIRFTRNLTPTFLTNAEFTVNEVIDPSGFSTPTAILAFRRPSPTANESKVPNTGWAGAPSAPFDSVAATSGGAARLHEQLPAIPPVEIVNAMRDFQLGVVFAQIIDCEAGRLDADGAKGGAANLLAQPFYVGINDLQGHDPMGHPFTRKAFDLFDAWAPPAQRPRHEDGKAKARAAIYRGQELFNNFEFDITGVNGLNDLLAQPTVRGTCSTCHNAPNVGSHSVYRMFDIGTADAANCGDALPLITLQNKANPTLARQVCDMGRATGSGKWADIGGFRAPPLRGLAARAPYFHDGQAKDLKAVVKYFDRRFNMGLHGDQKTDLEAFLRAL
jgi:cytochrome c peroxidase